MKRKNRLLRFIFALTLIFSLVIGEASGLPVIAPTQPSPEETEEETAPDETTQAEMPGETTKETAEEPADEPEDPDEEPEEPLDPAEETEAFINQMVNRKASGGSAATNVDVKAADGIPSEESNIQSGLLLAKRLKKLAEESEFNKIVFRGSGFVNVRSEALSASDKVGKMYYNAVATILSSVFADDGLWYEIESGKVHGYVKSEFFVSGVEAMDMISDITSNWVQMADDSQRLYEFADTNSSTLATLSSDVRYRSAGKDGNFTKVYVGDTANGTKAYGYVPTDKLIFTTDVITAVTTQEESLTQNTAAKVVSVQSSLDASRAASRAAASRQASIEASKASSRAAASRQQSIENSKLQEILSGRNLSEYGKYIPAGTSALRRAIVEDALRFVGVLDYVWGGESLVYGADCSGFCRAIYARHGINVIHYTISICKQGTSVSSLAKARPADLIMYNMDFSAGTGHVGIYMGNNLVVHSPRTGQKVKVNKADFMSITMIRNVIGD